ncbi:MAG: tyrosine-type recombinase/integrase [Acidimicrobiales bacterium]
MSRKFTGEFVVVRGPLAEHAEGFVAVLEGRGYAPRTIETQARMLRDLSGWLEDRGVVVDAIDSDVLAEYAAHRRGRTATLRSPSGLVPLVGFLRESAAIPAAVAVAPVDGVRVVLAEFSRHLVSARGVSPATVRSYCSQVRPLVAEFAGRWEALTSDGVREFIDGHVVRDRPRSVQVRINAVRGLLRWLWRERRVAEPLHEQVLSMYAPGGPPPPRGLSTAEVAALLASLSSDPASRVRDVALVTLMLRLGLRAGETASLRLESLDWRDGTVTVCGKRGRVDRVPIPRDVGVVLVAYLREGRPSGTTHRAVFLAVDAPHAPIRASAVASMARRAIGRAGIDGGGGSHRLRHTAAMRVVAGGGGLVEAGQLLRHSSMTATGIYARADVAALAELARPWPGSAR